MGQNCNKVVTIRHERYVAPGEVRLRYCVYCSTTLGSNVDVSGWPPEALKRTVRIQPVRLDRTVSAMAHRYRTFLVKNRSSFARTQPKLRSQSRPRQRLHHQAILYLERRIFEKFQMRYRGILLSHAALYLQVHPHLFRRQVLAPAAHAPLAVAMDQQHFVGGGINKRRRLGG